MYEMQRLMEEQERDLNTCPHCDGKGEIETDNNGPVVPCPVCTPPAHKSPQHNYAFVADGRCFRKGMSRSERRRVKKQMFRKPTLADLPFNPHEQCRHGN